IRYNSATDTNDPMLPNTRWLRTLMASQYCFETKNFDANPDINASNAGGWNVEIGSFPANTQGFNVTGSRNAPIYYSFTPNTLSRRDGNNWTPIANNVVGSRTFGPAFVNPYDSQVLYIITSNGIQVSVDGGNHFSPEPELT